MLRARECALIPDSSTVFTLDSHLSLSRSLGACQAPPLPLTERPPSIAIIIGKEKMKANTLDGRTNHNLLDPYIWHLLLTLIHKQPSSPYICHLLSPHLWYGYLEIEKCCTFYFARLLLPSWIMYPNNSFKAFVHFLELCQFVMQFILEFFSRYWFSLQKSNGKLEPYVLEISLGNGRGLIYRNTIMGFFGYKILHCCVFFL